VTLTRLYLTQGGAGIRGPGVATSGGSMTVEIGPNDNSIEVTNSSTGVTVSHDAVPGKGATIPVGNVPGGTTLIVTVGKGMRTRIIFVEVTSSSP